MIIVLSFLDIMRGGGIPVYTAHLVRALQHEGHPVMLARVMGGSNDLKPVRFTHGVVCHRWSAATALAATRGHKTIITATATRAAAALDKRHDLDLVLPFLQRRVPFVIHDLGWWDQAKTTAASDILDAAKTYDTPIITIRYAVEQQLREWLGLSATTLLHPYVRAASSDHKRTFAAISATRISHRKRTLWLAQANRLLPADKQIQIFGTSDRPYHMRLDAAVPEWRTWYRGPFPSTANAAVDLLRQSHLAIDMTIIEGDGGGTQYAMLEAWDAETPLVVHSSWMLSGSVPALTADSPEQIADIVRNPPDTTEITREGLLRLDEHKPEAFVPSLLRAL